MLAKLRKAGMSADIYLAAKHDITLVVSKEHPDIFGCLEKS